MTAAAQSEKRGSNAPEMIAAGVLLVLGLAWSAVLRPYDASVWQIAVCSTAIGSASAITLFALALRRLGVSAERRWPSAVWAATLWNSLLLSQLAYVGFYFIPVEIAVATIILRKRAHLSRWFTAGVLAGVVRLACLAIVYAIREPLKMLFPWH